MKDKTYYVPMQMIFDGTIKIRANSFLEAKQIARKGVFGNITIEHDKTEDRIQDWDFEWIPSKIKVSRRKPPIC